MARNRRVIFVIIVAAAVVAGAWMHGRPGTPQLAGDWKSWRTHLHIERAGEHYTIVVDSPDTFLGGLYTGELRSNGLKLEGPLSALCGQIAYSNDGEALEFCGEQFERIKN